MGKIIILEGCDGAGKTNIAENLSKILQIPVFKPYGQDIMRKANNPELVKNKIYEGIIVSKILWLTNSSLIFDRYYPSEFVYSRVFGRPFYENELKEVDIAFSALGSLIVVCYKNNLDDYKDEIIDKKYAFSLMNIYDEFLEWTNCKKLKLNTTDHDINREVHEIMKAL